MTICKLEARAFLLIVESMCQTHEIYQIYQIVNTLSHDIPGWYPVNTAQVDGCVYCNSIKYMHL